MTNSIMQRICDDLAWDPFPSQWDEAAKVSARQAAVRYACEASVLSRQSWGAWGFETLRQGDLKGCRGKRPHLTYTHDSMREKVQGWPMYVRTDRPWAQALIRNATAVLFMAHETDPKKRRIHFIPGAGQDASSPGGPSMLCAFGEEEARALNRMAVFGHGVVVRCNGAVVRDVLAVRIPA